MQAYSRPERESDPGALPDVEVFWYDPSYDVDAMAEGCEEQELPEAGWYWWACFPGCLPDGDMVGPFETAEEATADAQERDD